MRLSNNEKLDGLFFYKLIPAWPVKIRLSHFCWNQWVYDVHFDCKLPFWCKKQAKKQLCQS